MYILCLGKGPTFFPSFHGPIIFLGRRGHLKNRHSSQPNSFYIRYAVSYLYYSPLHNNASFVMFLTCWVLKSKVFSQKTTVVKLKLRLLWIDIAPGPQKVPKLYIQSHFSMSKINFFWKNLKKESFKNINLGDHFL